MCADRRDPRIDALLRYPGIWRAGGSEPADSTVIPTGFAPLNERLPGGGWPRQGLVEVLLDSPGTCELGLLLPAFAALHASSSTGWLTLVAPPHEPYAPALMARGIDLQRLLVVRAAEVLWAVEQVLRSGSCLAVLAWLQESRSVQPQWLRRLQLAAVQSGTLALVCRTRSHAAEASPAVLRLEVSPVFAGYSVSVLKGRGGPRPPVLIRFRESG